MGIGVQKRLGMLLAGLAIALIGPPVLAQTVLAPTVAPAGKLTIEINKFEEIAGGGCRAFFLFQNATGKSFEGFEMSLAIFNADGVIDRLLSIDAAPLPVARTTLKLFEIPQIACASISEVLLHDVPVCKPQNEDNTDCYPMLELKSRTSAPLEE